MTVWMAALLGVLQGLTEFLPVSSSGHLVLFEKLLDVHSPGAGFEVFAHLGTLLAILIHYRSDLLAMVTSVFGLKRDEDFRLFLLILLGSIPAAAIGLLFEDRIEALFDEPRYAAVFLLVTGAVLLSTRLARDGDRTIGPLRAFAIGIAQAAAILPGISRSGSTIAAGIFLGMDRPRAARFSFLLVIPALLGAAALTLGKSPPSGEMTTAYLVGGLTAFGSGYLALRFLLAAVGRGRFDRFGFYCLAVGVAALLLLP